MKDVRDFRASDVGGKALDLIFLDCHNWLASKALMQAVQKENLLSAQAFVVLHDTGLHPTSVRGLPLAASGHWAQMLAWPDPGHLAHQPVERLLATWLGAEAAGEWQR
eukprot:4724734-Prymnesium_polylepis.1